MTTTAAARDMLRLKRLFVQCTFTPVLGSPALIRRSTKHVRFISTAALPVSRPMNVFAVDTKAPAMNHQQRCYSLNPRKSPESPALVTTVTPWTKDDDKMLALLRRKKTSLDQIQIYLPHQPIAVIEARLHQFDERANQKPTFQRWTVQEDETLAKAVREMGTSSWSEVSDIYFSPSTSSIAAASTATKAGLEFNSAAAAAAAKTPVIRRRSPRSCQIRWNFLHPDSASPSYRTGAWSAEELELFQELVNPSPTPDSPNDWDEISRAIGTRSAIQCHSQFKTVMHQGTKGKWTVEEVNKLVEARKLYGPDWQKVAKHVGTRAPGQVRQKWNQFSEDMLRRLEARHHRGDTE